MRKKHTIPAAGCVALTPAKPTPAEEIRQMSWKRVEQCGVSSVSRVGEGAVV